MNSRAFKSLWIGCCLGLFLLSRAPMMLCPFEINVDESMMTAQAMRYQQDLTPWRSVEGESNGPIDSWVLLLAHELGMPFGYRALHTVAALVLAATLLASACAARRLFGDAPAMFGLAAGSWWLAWAPVQEFEHYASELMPCLLISLALAAMARARQGPHAFDWRRGLVAGILVGLVPWGKLQAGPVALALGAWGVADALYKRPRPCLAYVTAMIGGAIAPSAILLGWVLAAGAGPEFWRAYILGGLYHAPSKSWELQLSNVRDLLSIQPSAPWFWDSAVLAIGVVVLRRQLAQRAVGRRALVLTGVLVAAGLYVTLRPITQWGHYAFFCLTPLMLAAALCARFALGDDGGGAIGATDPRRRAGWAILAVALLPLPVAAFLYKGDFQDVSQKWNYTQSHVFDTQHFIAQAVRYYVPHPESLAVWGWEPSLYVDLGLPPAVRSAGYAFLKDGNPSEGLLRDAFIRDLEQSKPQVIVDVEDFIYRGQRLAPPEIFPELVDYLQENYRLVGQGKGVKSNPDYTMEINIYRRIR